MTATQRFVNDAELAVLHAFEVLVEGNPFLPSRVQAERTVLGRAHVDHGEVWHIDPHVSGVNSNLAGLIERAESLVRDLRARLLDGASSTPEQRAAYCDLVFYVLFERHQQEFFRWLTRAEDADVGPEAGETYSRYRKDYEHFLRLKGVELPVDEGPEQLFALGYQIRRAFHHTYGGIHGGSLPAAQLRAAVWQSIFTHDARRYRRGLYARMNDIPTLVLGASGTGKELVARAIGLSGHVPFDAQRRRFEVPASALFRPVNLAALPAALMESELFGHRKGAFTGAHEDHPGWLESCPPLGTVFLDEIGELDPGLQTKLLRVVQSRVFQRVGETRERRFEGRIVTATHRDLGAAMHAGRFRPDLYYRLCADVVRTPTLSEQIAAAPDELESLVRTLARRIVDRDESDALAEEVVRWIDGNLGRDYPWPGNVRELEQCVRNVLVRGSYFPAATPRGAGADAFLDAVERGRLTADDLLREYCSRAYRRIGSYEGTARALGLDRRTVKSYLARPQGEKSDPLSGESPEE